MAVGKGVINGRKACKKIIYSKSKWRLSRLANSKLTENYPETYHQFADQQEEKELIPIRKLTKIISNISRLDLFMILLE